MKKTKFIGVVNGVEFNNVSEYNETVTRAMETGNVDAYTKTVTVDNEPEEMCGYCDDDRCVSGGPCCDDEVIINYLPNFFEGTDEVNSNYIDLNIGNLDEPFDVCRIQDNLNCHGDCIEKVLPDFNLTDLQAYLADTELIINHIAKDRCKNEHAKNTYNNRVNELRTRITELQAELQEAEDVLTVTDRADMLIELHNNFYNNLRNAIVCRMNECLSQEQVVETTMVETTPQQEATVDSSHDTGKALEKIFKLIFG